jgi:hypothetical protein
VIARVRSCSSRPGLDHPRPRGCLDTVNDAGTFHPVKNACHSLWTRRNQGKCRGRIALVISESCAIAMSQLLPHRSPIRPVEGTGRNCQGTDPPTINFDRQFHMAYLGAKRSYVTPIPVPCLSSTHLSVHPEFSIASNSKEYLAVP